MANPTNENVYLHLQDNDAYTKILAYVRVASDGCSELVSVGSGCGYLESKLRRDLPATLSIVCIDPAPESFLSYHPKFFTEPQFPSVEAYLETRNGPTKSATSSAHETKVVDKVVTSTSAATPSSTTTASSTSTSATTNTAANPVSTTTAASPSSVNATDTIASDAKTSEKETSKTATGATDQKSKNGVCLLLHWSAPNKSTYDWDAVMTLKPDSVVIVFEQIGGAGSRLLHKWLEIIYKPNPLYLDAGMPHLQTQPIRDFVSNTAYQCVQHWFNLVPNITGMMRVLFDPMVRNAPKEIRCSFMYDRPGIALVFNTKLKTIETYKTQLDALPHTSWFF